MDKGENAFSATVTYSPMERSLAASSSKRDLNTNGAIPRRPWIKRGT